MVQWFNLGGVLMAGKVLTGFKPSNLVVPHCQIPSVSSTHLPYQRLAQAGAKAIIFDKDNTLTYPLDMRFQDVAVEGLMKATQVGLKIGILSNHVGSTDDPNDSFSTQLRNQLPLEIQSQIIFLKSSQKKPMVPIDEITNQLPPSMRNPEQLVLVGDRLFTDILFGNLHRLCTILVDPLQPRSHTSPLFVNSISHWERLYLQKLISSHRLQPPSHPLAQTLNQSKNQSKNE